VVKEVLYVVGAAAYCPAPQVLLVQANVVVEHWAAFAAGQVISLVAALMTLIFSLAALGHIANYILVDLSAPE
jgi:hypothetical protein